MSSILLTPPAVEPVPLADAKAYLRVEHDDDDDVISGIIEGARLQIEAQTRRASPRPGSFGAILGRAMAG
jgi:uncharacterized phiE125 gp8 family phage protein